MIQRIDEKFPPKEVVKTYDPVVKEVNGRKLRVFVERVEDPNAGLLYSDFSLESLLAADAGDLLQPLSPLSRNRLDALDIAGFAADHISADLGSVTVVEENKNNVKEDE